MRILEWFFRPFEYFGAWSYRKSHRKSKTAKKQFSKDLDSVFYSIFNIMPEKLFYKKWVFGIITPNENGVRYINYKTKSSI